MKDNLWLGISLASFVDVILFIFTLNFIFTDKFFTVFYTSFSILLGIVFIGLVLVVINYKRKFGLGLIIGALFFALIAGACTLPYI